MLGFDPAQSEFDGQADDLHDLLARYDMLPVIIGGASSGARLSLAFTLRHPVAVRALLLWRVTGGRFAVERLIEKYYEDPDCELNVMTSGTRNIEMADLAEWDAREEAMATLFADFLARKLALRRAG